MRDIVLNNFWWKITALLLAVIAWFSLNPKKGIPQLLPGTVMHTRYLVSHPVTISKPATDTRQFKVTPSTVDITLTGEEKTLRALRSSEVRANVDITETMGETNQNLKIRTDIPPNSGISIRSVSPEVVQVELLK